MLDDGVRRIEAGGRFVRERGDDRSAWMDR
jgi:hypothetical protein